MLNIVLFGPPGAGKGTQSEKLIEKYGLVHLSTGDIFRANIKGATELGTIAKGYMDKGQLVPDEITIRMLESEVNKNPTAKGFIFDGFPRTKAQAQALDNLLGSKNTSITLMLALEVGEEELKNRLMLRGKNSGRLDDQIPEIIQNRIDVYNNETLPVKAYYTAQGKYRGVYGIGEIDEIFGALCSVIDAEIYKKPSDVVMPKVFMEQVPVRTVTKPARAVGRKSVKKVVKAVKTPARKKVKSTRPAVKKAVAKKAAKKKTVTKKKIAQKVVKKKVIKSSKSLSSKGKKPIAKKPVKKAAKKVVKKTSTKKILKKITNPNKAKKSAKKVTKNKKR